MIAALYVETGGCYNPLYVKLRRAGIPRDAAIAECMR